MAQTIAVLGAGPGLGRSVARRFGREGFQVALVARTPARLDGLAAELAADGITVAGFPADLGDRAALPGLIEAVTARFGPIDVLQYAPSGPEWMDCQTGVLEAGAESFEFPLDLLLRTPAELVRQVVPGMIERGRGAVLFGLSVGASVPYPQAGNLGTASMAARGYLRILSAALEGTGVYAGLLQVGGMVTGSDGARRYIEQYRPAQLPPGLDPDDLAAACWDLYLKRDRFEVIMS
jgi:short-subunit dehydrogenase